MVSCASIFGIMQHKVSQMAETLMGSEIIKLSGEINKRIAEGAKIYNLTIGDFNPSIFPIPDLLNDEIIRAYQENQTNYPPADGILPLRQAVSNLIWEKQNLTFSPDEILIAAGARPLIYAIFTTIVDPGDKVISPVPSWNNNHYCHLSSAQQILVETKAENHFMPTRADIEPHISEAVLVALCSPLNPTGTMFSKEQLHGICELVVEENKRREGTGKKPVYIMYDQIYNLLSFGNKEHYNPVSLFPELKEYTIFVDGISKCLAATGVRVGWSFGPTYVINKMKSILGHVGAWAPKAEQVAVARYIDSKPEFENFLVHMKDEVKDRLQALYEGFKKMNEKGLAVEAIAPEGAIYLSVKFSLLGKKYKNQTLQTTFEIASLLISEASFAVVPFTAFGNAPGTEWFRISVGTCTMEQIPAMLEGIEKVLSNIE